MMNNATSANTSCIFDTPAYKAVSGVRAVLSFISLVCILLIVLLILLFKKHRFFTQRLILYMCIAAASSELSGCLNVTGTIAYTSTSLSSYCVVIGFLDQYTGCCVLLAQTVLTLVVFLKVMFSKNTERLEIPFFIFIFFSPILICWIPFINLAYGPDGPWCWIRNSDEQCKRFLFGSLCQLLVWYVPLYLIMGTLTILLTIVIVTLRKRRYQYKGSYDPQAFAVNTRMEREARPLIAYPIIFIVLNMVLLINRIYKIVNLSEGNISPSPGSEVLWFISAMSYPLQGVIIAAAYTLDPETRRKITFNQIRAAAMSFTTVDKIEEYPIEFEKDVSKSFYIREN